MMARRAFVRLLVVGIGITLLAACDTEGNARENSSAVPIGTEAGEIIRSSEPRLGDAAWSIGGHPLVALGRDGADQAEHDAADVFHDIRSVVLLPGGDAIAVADGGTNSVRLFGLDGVHRRSFGRDGDGPGEFRSIDKVFLCGGRLYVSDARAGLVSAYTLEGGYVDRFRFEAADGLPAYRLACNDDRRFALMGGGWDALPDEVGPYRPSTRLTLADGTGSTVATLGQIPADERYFFGQNDGPRPFGRETTLAMQGNHIYVGAADSYSIDVLDARTGDPLHRIERAYDPDRVTRARLHPLIERSLERAREGGPNRERMAREYWDNLELPEEFPPYRSILVNDAGHLWVERYRLPGAEVGVWDVFGPTGAWLTTVRLPPAFRLHDVRGEYLAGVFTDDLGVEHVHLYPLRRNADGDQPN